MKKINSIKEIKENYFSGLNESQLYHYFEPEPGVFIAESPNVIERALNAGYEPLVLLISEGIVGAQERLIEKCSEVYIMSKEIEAEIAGFSMTRGALCAMRRKKLPEFSDIYKNNSRIAVLENIMNPTNVGAVFRSAAALGMDAVILTKASTDPLYRRSARVSMGTVFQIPWTVVDSLDEDFFRELKDQSFVTAAMALRQNSVNINDEQLLSNDKIAIILGTESEGLTEQTIEYSDYTVCIPMMHGVDSLNVAAAGAVAFWNVGHMNK
ncbi:MAG: RNA methyltransferase [Lachnospiraceae bacterium]|nr:RNA methyltransferase [Lachnospiraceae bacterium]